MAVTAIVCGTWLCTSQSHKVPHHVVWQWQYYRCDFRCAISWYGVLVCFTDLAVYVDREGKRSRKEELLWHSIPLSICKQFCWHWPGITMHFLSPHQFFHTLPVSLSCSTLGSVLWQWHWIVWCRPGKVDADYPYQEGVCVCVHVWHVQSDCVISRPAPIVQSHRIGSGQTWQVSVLAWNVWNARQHDVIPQSLGDTVLASCELGMWVHSDMSARMPLGAEHAWHPCPGQAIGTTVTKLPVL